MSSPTQGGNPARRVALVTGGSSGIGRASAIALARNGWAVVLSGRRQDQLDETIKLSQEDDPSAAGKKVEMVAVAGDLTKPEDVKALFAAVKDNYGRLDFLFNNAGSGTPAQPLEDIPLDQYLQCVNINLVAPFLCTQEAFKLMRDQSPQGGRILNNGSISAHAPRPLSAPYTMTKHGVTGLTKASSLDGREYNITVGQIDIGNAATAMGGRHAQGSGALQPNGELMVEATMEVEHVADAVLATANLPLHVNMLFQTIMANKMPFVGRG